jgi:hypothetical protein
MRTVHTPRQRMVSFFTLVVVNSHKFISYTDWYLVILSHRIGLSLLDTIIPTYRQTTFAQDHSPYHPCNAGIDRQAANNGCPSPVTRAAPTGIASHNIGGQTFHSILRLPVKSTFQDLPIASLKALQVRFKDIYYIIIDEKSKVGLMQLSYINRRLQQIKATNCREPFPCWLAPSILSDLLLASSLAHVGWQPHVLLPS